MFQTCHRPTDQTWKGSNNPGHEGEETERLELGKMSGRWHATGWSAGIQLLGTIGGSCQCQWCSPNGKLHGGLNPLSSNPEISTSDNKIVLWLIELCWNLFMHCHYNCIITIKLSLFAFVIDMLFRSVITTIRLLTSRANTANSK